MNTNEDKEINKDDKVRKIIKNKIQNVIGTAKYMDIKNISSLILSYLPLYKLYILEYWSLARNTYYDHRSIIVAKSKEDAYHQLSIIFKKVKKVHSRDYKKWFYIPSLDRFKEECEEISNIIVQSHREVLFYSSHGDVNIWWNYVKPNRFILHKDNKNNKYNKNYSIDKVRFILRNYKRLNIINNLKEYLNLPMLLI